MRRLSVKEYIKEALGNFFSFDSKLVRSLIPFFTRPGLLSRRFVDGKRAEYIPPFRLYMFFSVVFFLIAGCMKNEEGMDDFLQYSISDHQLTNENLGQFIDSLTHVDKIRMSEDSLQMKPGEKRPFDEKLVVVHGLANLEKSAQEGLRDLRIENNSFNRFRYRFLTKFGRIRPGELVNQAFDNGALLIFLFIPIMALVLKLFYFRHNIYFSEHLTFLFQTNAFLFFLASVTLISSLFTDAEILPISLVVFALYFLLSMKLFYKNGWAKTMLKFLGISMLYMMFFAAFSLFCLAAFYVII